MFKNKRINDSVHLFTNELASRVVAKTGIPSDRYHLGKIILQSLKDAPEFVHQIDGQTGEMEKNFSVLERSVRCAISLKMMGLRKGDVIVLMAPNHIDLAIPFYAALYLGVMIAAIDYEMDIRDLHKTFNVDKPNIVFCQSKRVNDIQNIINQLELNCKIVTFDKIESNHLYFKQLLEKSEEFEVYNFSPTDFDTNETVAILMATSGTTGVPKATALTHKNFSISPPYLWTKHTQFPTPTPLVLVASRIQWLTALMHYCMSPILRYTRLQCSATKIDNQLFYDLIKKYRPSYTIFSATLLYSLMKGEFRNQCDFTCFETIHVGGTPVPQSLVNELKEIMPNTELLNVYGMTEVGSLVTIGNRPAPGSCGRPVGCFQYKLMNIDTQEEILDPNVPGELWLKGPSIFKEYYNNPKETEEAFAEDRWFKTGDLFYIDDNENFFFVERIKLLLKYNRHKISPVEIENVVRKHPGVLDVAVVGIPDPFCGELPTACVVLRDHSIVTAQEIKDVVKESLSDVKQLRGGVLFLPALPLTPTIKVDRRKLKSMALQMERE